MATNAGIHRKVSSCDRCAWEPDCRDDLCVSIVVAGRIWPSMLDVYSVCLELISAPCVCRGFG